MNTVVITIPTELVDEFVNHLGRLRPDKAKHITIYVPTEEQQRDIIDILTPGLVDERTNHLAPQYPFQ